MVIGGLSLCGELGPIGRVFPSVPVEWVVTDGPCWGEWVACHYVIRKPEAVAYPFAFSCYNGRIYTLRTGLQWQRNHNPTIPDILEGTERLHEAELHMPTIENSS